MKKFLIATHNQGKVNEFREMFASLGIEVISAIDLGLPEIEETGKTFAENARLKAVSAAKGAKMPALADDSGLCVEALDGAPGIYSARWAGEKRDFLLAAERIKDELKAKDKNINGEKAYFICVLSLAEPNGSAIEFTGRVDGSLIYPPRGKNGFGYDPIFIPQGSTQTYGEIIQQEKNQSNHRARAFDKFKHYLLKTAA